MKTAASFSPTHFIDKAMMASSLRISLLKGQDKTTSCWEKSQVLQAQGSSRVSKTFSDQTVTETSLRFAATAVLL